MFRDRLGRLEAIVSHIKGIGRRPAPPPRRVQTAQEVIDLLQEQVDALRAETGLGTVEKARALAYLAGVARKAIETGTLAARLEAMERVLKHRSKNGP
jgi:hypothetical protein